MQNQTIIRQKATFEKVCDFKIQEGKYLLCPREDISNGTMYCPCTSGEIFSFNEGSSELISTIVGEPFTICFDMSNCIYIAEMNNGTIFYKYASKYFNNFKYQI